MYVIMDDRMDGRRSRVRWDRLGWDGMGRAGLCYIGNAANYKAQILKEQYGWRRAGICMLSRYVHTKDYIKSFTAYSVCMDCIFYSILAYINQVSK